jgi:hypothetical protein
MYGWSGLRGVIDGEEFESTEFHADNGHDAMALL